MKEATKTSPAEYYGELYNVCADGIYRLFACYSCPEDAERLTEELFYRLWEKNGGKKLPCQTQVYKEAWKQVEGKTLVIMDGEGGELLTAVTQLPREEQQMVLLRFIADVPSREAAQIMDLPYDQFCLLQHQGLLRFRGVMETLTNGKP